MKYTQFISAIAAQRDSAKALFDRPLLHEDPEFRRWRFSVTDLISQITRQGYPVNCNISARVFDRLGSPDTPAQNAARTAAYNRDLQDTINELEVMIENHAKYGEPANADARPSATGSEVFDPAKLTLGQLLKHLTLPQLWAILGSLATLLGAVATLSYRVGAGRWPWE